jgi:ABC-type glutathione transport system ATPase component
MFYSRSQSSGFHDPGGVETSTPKQAKALRIVQPQLVRYVQPQSNPTIRPPATKSNEPPAVRKQSRALAYGKYVVIGVRFAIGAVIGAGSPSNHLIPVVTASSTEPIIAIVGATGAGKSSLIKLLGGRNESGREPVVGHSLGSCMCISNI